MDDFLDLPDDQIMAMSAPTSAPAAAPPVDESTTPTPPASEAGGVSTTSETTSPAAPAAAAEGGVESGANVDALSAADDAIPTPKVETPAPVTTPTETPKPADEVTTPVEAAKPADKPADKPAEAQPKAGEYTEEAGRALFDRLLGRPIKANGKELQLQSADEVEKLVQMGANYTKKMQALQPALRVVKMLENNGLLDEAKLSHLIDISKGDAGAIQKMLADKGFNALEADSEKAASYTPTDHRVTDAEMNFDAVLGDLESTPTGVELISEVAGQWDEQSKRAVFQEPKILTALAEQKANGLYAQVTTEVERLRALGEIPATIPFLQAYHAVAEMLTERMKATQETAPPSQPVVPAAPAAPVETRVATPAPAVKNTAQAQATAPVRTAPASATPAQTNWLDMPDSEFMKGRL